jgi:hypothetical protein
MSKANFSDEFKQDAVVKSPNGGYPGAPWSYAISQR